MVDFKKKLDEERAKQAKAELSTLVEDPFGDDAPASSSESGEDGFVPDSDRAMFAAQDAGVVERSDNLTPAPSTAPQSLALRIQNAAVMKQSLELSADDASVLFALWMRANKAKTLLATFVDPKHEKAAATLGLTGLAGVLEDMAATPKKAGG